MFISAYAKILNFKTLEKSFHSKNCHRLKKPPFLLSNVHLLKIYRSNPIFFLFPKFPRSKTQNLSKSPFFAQYNYLEQNKLKSLKVAK